MDPEVGAGHCQLVPGPDGKPVALPKSVAYDSWMTPNSTSTTSRYWPSCARAARRASCGRPSSDDAAAAAVEGILQEFGA